VDTKQSPVFLFQPYFIQEILEWSKAETETPGIFSFILFHLVEMLLVFVTKNITAAGLKESRNFY